MGFRTKVNGKYLDEMTTEEQQAYHAKSKLAEMFATCQPPMASTDTSLFTGDKLGLGQIHDPFLIEHYKREAKAAGINPDAAMYMPELADYPGDPRAWVRDRGEMKQVLEERGWGCEDGFVKVQAPEPTAAPPEPPRLAESIIQDVVLDKLVEKGIDRIDMTQPANIKLIGDLREQAVEEHGRPLDRTPVVDLSREIEKELAGAVYSDE